jgi:hypothetical protein
MLTAGGKIPHHCSGSLADHKMSDGSHDNTNTGEILRAIFAVVVVLTPRLASASVFS